ncbi:tetratricopeptide repeat protein [bacterium SCSIO 12696]|nr:tetratricopeptide repeat protein [bacterium SCSIO 12696]
MSAHLSEEEQVEALKRWWQRNGRTTIVAVVVGVAAWWGLQQWNQQQQGQRESNSLLYSQVQELAQASSLNDKQRSDLLSKSHALKSQAEGSQYGWYAALMLAKLAFDEADYDRAANELQYVLDGSDDTGLKTIAQLRLARVEVTRGNLDSALELLQLAENSDMAAAYAELRGDIYMQKGDTEAARVAYQEALNGKAPNSGDSQLLTLKLNRVTPADAQSDDTEVTPSADNS